MNKQQYQIAIELGYNAALVKKVLTRQSFKRAGDLIDCLWEEELLEETVEETVEDERKIPSAPPLPSEEKLCNLLEETSLLYHQSKCLRCKERDRNVVLLPCYHFSLCRSCVSRTALCPKKDCRQEIEDKNYHLLGMTLLQYVLSYVYILNENITHYF